MTGFNTTPDEMRNASREIDMLATDLRSVRSAWDGATAEGARAFATTTCGEAFNAFQQALFDNLSKRLDALERTAQDVHTSANTYDAADESGRGQIGGVR
ncbi:WXG100 family type VII secretion target [Saccharopolyspora flava]|uniref:Excreted virulence factor EspC, type VII ESX diderm n=1 Tax=Saccharopolyspora flava TaxID=95161 RepID=A0A1I6QM70_9PSEU|nr:type VII secretion target [Saccharopolyspora flava]SFS53378.1 Excreted virulence factor EspC, type VII ESX diderm [Saccharopolyspora flava]